MHYNIMKATFDKQDFNWYFGEQNNYTYDGIIILIYELLQENFRQKSNL